MKNGVKFIIEIPDTLHKKLKMKALQEEITLKDMVLPLLEKLVR